MAIAVEVEGGMWVEGHRSPNRYLADIEKYNEAALRGWLVLRVTSEMVDDGTAVGLVERAIRSRMDRELRSEFAAR
jgi:hypothetical protein